MLGDEVEGFTDAGEHTECQHVHLQHAERIDVILIPFQKGAVLHGTIVDRHGLVEALARQHKATDMLRKMARKSEQRAGKADGLLDIGIVGI